MTQAAAMTPATARRGFLIINFQRLVRTAFPNIRTTEGNPLVRMYYDIEISSSIVITILAMVADMGLKFIRNRQFARIERQEPKELQRSKEKMSLMTRFDAVQPTEQVS